MNREGIIKTFQNELKDCDPDSQMAQAMELAIELLHHDKRQNGSLMRVIERYHISA